MIFAPRLAHLDVPLSAKLTSTFNDPSSLINRYLRQEWHLTKANKKGKF